MTLCTFGSRFARIPKPGQEGDALEIAPWLEVFKAKHADDAHAWPYVRYEDGQVAAPIRVPARDPEGLVLCSLIFLDYDESTDHRWILERMVDIPEDSYLSKWAVIYPTKGGMRFVYRLDEPVAIDEYPEIVRGVAMDLFRLTKLKVDPTTDQWHRCFRLPMTTRNDGKAEGPTWEQPYFFEPLITDETVSPDELPRYPNQLPWKETSTTTVEAPTERPDVDSTVPEARIKLYKRSLRTSRFKEYLFENLAILPGRRDQTMMAMAAEVVGKCYIRVPECSAEEIYALMLPIALGFSDTDKAESSCDKLWRMVQHCWNGEVKKERDRNEKDALDRTSREQIIEAMLAKMPKSLVPNDPVDREMFARRHFCLQTAAGAFAITETGDYTTAALKTAQLPAYFNGALSMLDPDHFRTPQGRVLSGSEILNSFSTVVDYAEYIPDIKARSELVLKGDRKVVEVSPYALRSDLVEAAEFDKDVGEWLDSFHDSAKLKLWLASAVAIHRGPTAALFLKGPARAGKSMIALGVAECFGRRPVAGMHAFSEFNGGLVDSPVILVDEGLPERRSGMHTADLFRSLLTGAGVSTQKKFMDQNDSTVPYRIIMAANSYDMVTDLIGKRSLGSEDMDAFRERILVLEPGPGPSNYLDRMGNMAFTKDSPKGSWIGGSCRLARHIIKLYQTHFEENEFVRDGRRMLVEGRQHAAFTITFDLSGLGRDVAQALATNIQAFRENKGLRTLIGCMEIDDSGVWVRKWPFATANSQNPAQFARALERFCTAASRRSSIDMSTSFKVDMTKLIICADALGLSTKALREQSQAARGFV